MTLIQQFVQKISAFVAGAIAFVVLWLAISPYPLILGMVHERPAVSAIVALFVALIFDSVIGALGALRKSREAAGSKKPKHSPKDDDEPKTAYLCPNCGKTYDKPVNIMDPKTEKFLYAVCPKCAKPLVPPQPPAPTAPAPPLQKIVEPAEAAKALGVPEKKSEPPPSPEKAPEPAKTKKPIRIEILVHQPDEE